jgi:serine/threonine protein kinase
MALHCPSCGAENLETAQLCYACGEAIDGTGADELIGTIMFDSYKLVRVLGQGGMAVVYLGRNQLTEQEVAIKMLPPELAAYAEVKTRFLEEARTLAKLEHPNIVHLINFAEDAGRLCLVMQYAEGETFEELIDRVEQVPPDEAVRISIQTLEGLSHAHANSVVHRDIKPSNIIVRTDGSVKVTDFGIAKITRDHKLTQTGQTMGTVRYMAPEQVRGSNVDLRSDLYSLGITCYEALVGEPPFDGESQFEVMQMHLTTEPTPPRQAGVNVSEELEQVLLKSMAKEPDDRYQTAKAFRQALAATPEGRRSPKSTRDMEAVEAAGVSSATATPDKRSKMGILALVLGLIVVVGVGATLYSLLSTGQDPGSHKQSSSPPPGMGPKKAKPSKPARHVALAKIAKTLGRWTVTKGYNRPHKLYVLSDRALNVDHLAQAYLTTARTAYHRLLKDQAIVYPVKVRRLTVVLVSKKLLNDRSLWPEDAPTVPRTFFYDAQKGLVFTVSDEEAEAHLRFAIALHFCPLEIDNRRCMELASVFQKNTQVALF